ncbi:2-amino-4-hydroxy-6- hydroxymethyldihydropteridin e pyrophosphokinase [Bifidobacterium ramosum]|uniref:Bifunctional folate synthesis protein n=1 Tax=Bifidobacterium ramosum TaxID=1798158 RepID=A0A6L4X2E2_9BIFI|nr:2-amino-4-hydroxy-6-hydroxymethyldihydropteridine diphosphokinase [Bifidobacterium ramosum]KAB8288784.1 2-amino-4-hydroxy-6- hydroxymethyldihydropteridin e pyrophosphokinase [Bifidobacterium ramosum]NEG71353.1 2-amino-4-hydroxy-6-hydroxymethyldihydropteridine diphosphokinase [Bifidobacterium ramosum]
MDTIRLTGVRAEGTHGVLDFEHEQPQPFVVDVTLHVDLTRAGHTDDLDDTVNYGLVAERIAAIIQGPHVDLIERLAARIADAILTEHPLVVAVDVTVHKPQAPITVPFADVAVTINRSRDDADHGMVAGRNDAEEASIADIAGATDADDTRPIAKPAATAAVPSDTSASVHHAVVALGGNIGDVAATLRAAVAALDGLAGTQVTGVSPLYRTAAWGMADDTPDFLNAVVELDTTLPAADLLAGLQTIETAHGRTRESHWSSRTLDLDIIDYDGIVSNDPELTLPHPRAWQRAFVLAPWHALDPKAMLGGRHGGAVADLLAIAADRNDVRRVADDWMTGAAGRRAASAIDTAGAVTVTDGAETSRDGAMDTSATSASAAASESASRGRHASSTSEHTATAAPAFRTAIISMDSTSTDAEQRFRAAIVALDGIPGNQVDGISPLYHVSNLDGPDAMAAVVQLTTKHDARSLIAMLGSIETSVGGALDLDLVDMAGVTVDEPDCRVPWPSARSHAAVLAPWMDMDPDARLGGEPVSFLLAMAPDVGRVGQLSDNWIIGGTL